MKHGYILYTPPERWEEGILCGNGSMGALFMGGAARETVVLTNGKLYNPINEKVVPPAMVSRLPEIRGMLARGEYMDATNVPVKMMRDMYLQNGLFWTNPFMPGCDLIVESADVGSYENYTRSLDFEAGLGSVSFSSGETGYKREFFTSRKDRLGVMRLSSDKPATYRLALERHPEDVDPNYWSRVYPTSNINMPEISVSGDEIIYNCDFSNSEKTYRAKLKISNTNGIIKNGNNYLEIQNASQVEVLFILEAPGKDYIWDECAGFSFETLLKRHTEAHTSVYSRIALTLEDNITDDDASLWEESKNHTSPAFLEKVFNAGRYEILSASGETPPKLQGIWTGVYGVPWSGDYTNNGNVQTAISIYLPAGMFECMEGFFDYHEANVEDYRYNARHIYGCGGIHIPSRTSDRGIDFHFDNKSCMLFWTGGAAWIARFYYDYWLYTGDDVFLAKRAVPFMTEAARFYEDFLIEDENGKWLFSPSYSPENQPLNSDTQAGINSTIEISLLIELLNHLITACVTLGLQEEKIALWRTMLDKMPPYLINSDGALKEWATPELEDNYDHRHSSHLYMLYYDISRDIKENKELFAACEKAYALRIAGREKERGIMAFGLVQCGMSASHLYDKRTVGIMLESMAQNNYYPTFASSHDAGPKIFNADISGGFPALILETLAQSSPVCGDSGIIERYDIVLLPALTDCMPNGSVRGLRLRGGFSLDMSWRAGKLERYTIINTLNREYTVKVM